MKRKTNLYGYVIRGQNLMNLIITVKLKGRKKEEIDEISEWSDQVAYGKETMNFIINSKDY